MCIIHVYTWTHEVNFMLILLKLKVYLIEEMRKAFFLFIDHFSVLVVACLFDLNWLVAFTTKKQLDFSQTKTSSFSFTNLSSFFCVSIIIIIQLLLLQRYYYNYYRQIAILPLSLFPSFSLSLSPLFIVACFACPYYLPHVLVVGATTGFVK